MATQYKNPHEMTPEEILEEAEKLHILGDIGGAFFYDTIAMSLEGILIEIAEEKGEDSKLQDYHKRASELGHYLGSLIEVDLASKARTAGIALTSENKIPFMKKASLHYRTYEELKDRFQKQKVLQTSV
jgi:hypothetical protein